MRNLLLILLIFLLSLWETTVFPLNLTLVAVVIWAALRSVSQGLPIAWLAGLILDLLSGRVLGTTSLAFLLLTLPVYFYKNRFQPDRWQFLLPFLLIALVLYNLAFKFLDLPALILSTASVFFLLPIFKFFSQKTDQGRQTKLTFVGKL